jgi:hypothetical protein
LDKDDTESADDFTFFHGKMNGKYELGARCFERKKITSAGEKI